MAINSLARRENAMLDIMLTPDGALDNVLDRYAMLGQFYPIPPTDQQVWGGAAIPRVKSTDPGPRARAKVVRDGHA